VLAVALVLAALSAHVTWRGHGRATAPGGHRAAASAADIRGVAARWVVSQVSRSAIVSCDPAMCAALQARGMPSGNLLVLRQGPAGQGAARQGAARQGAARQGVAGQGAPDPLGSDVVVATSAVRSQFGARLSEVYAPDVLASFGERSARIEIRAVAPDGSAAYRSAARADLLARKAAGAQLLRNARVGDSVTARRQLAAGAPDSRLLVTLAAVATLQPVYVVAFGDAARGASAGVPLRSAILTAGGAAPGTGGGGYLRGIVAFLRAQRPPFLAASVVAARLGNGQPSLRIEFAAPSYPGLLGAGSAIDAAPEFNGSG